MKRIFIVAIAFICCLVSGRALAQDVQTATLQHGDELQVFYGPQAFVEAYSNAEDGDDITLSAGTFQTFNF